MPQLEKGGKWVFGWVVVNTYLKFQIPPEAYDEYGFMTDQELVFIKGSRRSGGFGVGRFETINSNEYMVKRIIAKTIMGTNRQISLPNELGVKPETRLLVVRGSNYALSFLVQGPIVELAQMHPEIEVFSV
ncbi:MAG: hypothetical protein Q8R87_04945 [Anaerolineaceae bacterium]|nr:hypothetical protein [Anaerolineaceae bacterium]